MADLIDDQHTWCPGLLGSLSIQWDWQRRAGRSCLLPCFFVLFFQCLLQFPQSMSVHVRSSKSGCWTEAGPSFSLTYSNRSNIHAWNLSEIPSHPSWGILNANFRPRTNRFNKLVFQLNQKRGRKLDQAVRHTYIKTSAEDSQRREDRKCLETKAQFYKGHQSWGVKRRPESKALRLLKGPPSPFPE